ncbi:type II toxin-antitoxin system VapC family toxin [Halonotius terrestris]|uniref:Type II toxin-antitoxin system VapC family toxin n=1 Tax=Halonotius terrestris TaxID=2487750 RepID=A0A8J8PAZ3_9EURY|nr:type II toxin-antitoxin system VapC family toxin [Halonotius terrestris]TQQ79966.1 type II toxin-antitoxin system VapC family toxin [Halonotius terrestris]
MLCFDNSVVAKFARPDPDENVVSYLQRNASQPWTIPATVLFEYLRYYSSQSAVQQQHHALTQRIQRVLPLNGTVAVEAIHLEHALATQEVTLDLADLLHAATARENNATFVTCDVADFDNAPVRQLLDIDIIEPVQPDE